MPRGWLKTSLNRLRFVKEGYDADNLALHPNLVIFDSGDEGSLSLVAAGSYTLSGFRTPGSGYTQIASWSLSFVPLCTFQFTFPPAELPMSPMLGIAIPGGASDGDGGTAPFPSMHVSTSGIYFRGAWSFSFAPHDITIHYQAYRLAVT